MLRFAVGLVALVSLAGCAAFLAPTAAPGSSAPHVRRDNTSPIGRPGQGWCVARPVSRPPLRRPGGVVVRGKDNGMGEMMAKLMHKYVLEGKRQEQLIQKVKKDYPLLPNPVCEWFLSQVTDMISDSGPTELEAFLPGAPREKRDALRNEWSVDLAEHVNIPFVPEEVEKRWASDFLDHTFDALLATDQQALTDAYLHAKLRETEA